MITFFKDWNLDSRVQASDITMDSQIRSEMLQLRPQNNGASTCPALQNLLVSTLLQTSLLPGNMSFTWLISTRSNDRAGYAP
ncbi:hypothetical protein U9M48_019750 [Paspalum notatum var. saurae]|uniref:Uncharacterized protein n=1 Tax=Paspalum notatum var. saurae TaxID=547442 RepID=A0AAQ3TDC3_PASNO